MNPATLTIQSTLTELELAARVIDGVVSGPKGTFDEDHSHEYCGRHHSNDRQSGNCRMDGLRAWSRRGAA